MRRRWSRPACSPGCSRSDWAQARQDRDGVTFGAALDADRLSRRRALRRASALGVLRTAHRAGADPGGRGQGHRRRHRRAGDALVRGDADRAGRAHRRDADAPAQERAARRRAPDRARWTRSAGSMRRGVGDRRADREPAEFAQRRAGRGVLHASTCAIRTTRVLDEMEADVRRPRSRRSASRSGLASRCRRSGTSRRCGSMPDCVAAVRRARRAVRLLGARHRLRRGPRRGLCLARRAGRDGLRAVPRRHQPQRGGVLLQGAMRRGRAGAAAGGARLRPAARRARRRRCTQGAGARWTPSSSLAVLFAAACHAGWNASIKRTLDPLATTVLIALGAGAGRAAVRAVRRHGPAPASWPWLIASIVIHLFYFAGLIESYRAGDLGQVYPIARGAAPLMTATVTTLFVGERLGLYGWGGIVLLAAGVLLLSLRGGRDLAKLDRQRGRLRAVHRGDDLRLFGGRRHRRAARRAGQGQRLFAAAVRRHRAGGAWSMRWRGAALRCFRRWRRTGRSGSAAARWR